MNLLFFHDWRLYFFIVFSITAFIQVLYFLFFFSRLAFYNSKPLPTAINPVSVIICARDEAANLTRHLPEILQQNYSGLHEIIVVNDNSFDDSKYILKEYKQSYKNLEVVELTQEAIMIRGKKFPLSIGIKTARHEIVLLTDSDCVPASEHWIDKMQRVYTKDTEIVLGYGAFHKNETLLNKIIRWETFHAALQYFSYALAGLPYMGVGRNLSYKKTIFFRNKGFSAHNSIPGGDDDLFINKAATKHNTKINIDKDSFTFSTPASTWKQWRKQKKRHYTTGKLYKPLHKALLGLYAFTHFVFYPFLIMSCIFYNWKYALTIFAGRLIIMTIIYRKTLRKLGEEDLFKSFFLFDVWMFFYYLIFASSLFEKPKQEWK